MAKDKSAVIISSDEGYPEPSHLHNNIKSLREASDDDLMRCMHISHTHFIHPFHTPI